MSRRKEIAKPWRSPDGEQNALNLRAHYADVFNAVAEIDALGHRLLKRTSDSLSGNHLEAIVGLALLRRAVTLFVGLRHHFESSTLEPAKLELRALFETLLAYRYIVHGGRRNLGTEVLSSRASREARARYFYVASRRRFIYKQQAMLAGEWGRQELSRAKRADMRKDIADIVTELDSKFVTQQRAFGAFRFAGPGRRWYFDDRQWYSFGFRRGRVNTIRALARRMGWLWEYEVLYDAFSALSHPRGISHDVEITGSQLSVYHPYMSDAFELIVNWACQWQFYVLIWAVKTYSPTSLPDLQNIHKKTKPALGKLRHDIPPGFL